MPNKSRAHKRYLLFIALLLVSVILFFGLRPKDLTLRNNVSWLSGKDGIHFQKYSIAFSPPLFAPGSNRTSTANGFSIELAVTPHTPHSDSFSILLAVDDGDDARQLVIGQWRSWLIAMNGNDYAHKTGIPRLMVDTADWPKDYMFITIAVDQQSAHIYVNGRPVMNKNKAVLRLPDGDQARLIVGNSAYGRHSWQGSLYGLAIYGFRLTAAEVRDHFHRWSSGGNFAYALEGKPLAAYLFNERNGKLARDHAGQAHLTLPPKMRALRRQLLAPPWEDFDPDADFVVDVILNFIAFVPLGFILVRMRQTRDAYSRRYIWVLATGLCVLTSLFIEITQSWMPSRSSTVLDLLLNSAGGWAGALLAAKTHRPEQLADAGN